MVGVCENLILGGVRVKKVLPLDSDQMVIEFISCILSFKYAIKHDISGIRQFQFYLGKITISDGKCNTPV